MLNARVGSRARVTCNDFRQLCCRKGCSLCSNIFLMFQELCNVTTESIYQSIVMINYMINIFIINKQNFVVPSIYSVCIKESTNRLI